MSAILLAAYLAPGWVPSEWNYRWSLPSDPLSDEGLGGGITWALDPAPGRVVRMQLGLISGVLRGECATLRMWLPVADVS